MVEFISVFSVGCFLCELCVETIIRQGRIWGNWDETLNQVQDDRMGGHILKPAKKVFGHYTLFGAICCDYQLVNCRKCQPMTNKQEIKKLDMEMSEKCQNELANSELQTISKIYEVRFENYY